MDLFAWSLELLRILLGWPPLVFLLCLVFRKPLGQALGAVTRVRWRDVEVEFERLAEEAHDRAERTVPSSEAPAPELPWGAGSELAPADEVIRGWASLVTATRGALARATPEAVRPGQRAAVADDDGALEGALQRGLLDPAQYALALQLGWLVRWASRGRGVVSVEAARHYRAAATRLAAYLAAR